MMAAKDAILVLNVGSATIKFSLVTASTLTVQYHGIIDKVTEQPSFTIRDAHDKVLATENIDTKGYEAALTTLLDWLTTHAQEMTLRAVGHRVVHGERTFSKPVIVTPSIMRELQTFIPLAPLHQPYNLMAIDIVGRRYPDLIQVACFDTAFHRTQPTLATLFALPEAFTAEGIIRYGFHGLSYEYIAQALPESLGDIADDKVIVAHLGGGASMCAMERRQSVATSMGFTALEGLMMGTRCGSIDPGVLLYLLQTKNMTVEQLSTLLYKQSGLAGVSGISGDIRELTASGKPAARLAIELFCYRAVRELGALCAQLQGCRAIVFTAGIGEHSALVRSMMCRELRWLGVELDTHANDNHATIISQPNSRVLVAVIPTDEEHIIARHTLSLLSTSS
jgi:acetate kinase